MGKVSIYDVRDLLLGKHNKQLSHFWFLLINVYIQYTMSAKKGKAQMTEMVSGILVIWCLKGAYITLLDERLPLIKWELQNDSKWFCISISIKSFLGQAHHRDCEKQDKGTNIDWSVHACAAGCFRIYQPCHRGCDTLCCRLLPFQQKRVHVNWLWWKQDFSELNLTNSLFTTSRSANGRWKQCAT